MKQTGRLGFSLGQYRKLLAAVQEGGYTCAFFPAPQGAKPLFLRHDIDKNLQWALDIARIEAEAGILATYFFLLRSPMYSLLAPESAAILQEITSLGHGIGLHCYLHRGFDASQHDSLVVAELDIFRCITGVETKVVSFHNPPPEVLRRVPATGSYLSTYAPEFLPPQIKYISDSNAYFRDGSPFDSLRAGAYASLQLLIHPIWWAREKVEPVDKILTKACEAVVDHLDRYLCSSNTLWAEYRASHGLTINLPAK